MGSQGDAILDTQEDRDGDGVVNATEQLLGSRPDMVDTDDDGLTDSEEQSMGTSPVNPVDPAISRAVVFGGGAGDYLEAPVSLLQRLTSWTLECWVQPSNSVSGAGYLVRRVVETLPNGTSVMNYVMGLETNAAGLRLYAGYVGTDGKPYIVRGGIVPSNGNWTHVAASYDSTFATLNLYTNGVLAASTNTFNLAPPVNGRGGDTFVRLGEDFAGGLDEVRVWNNVRSAAQILYNTNRVISASDTNGLIHYFRFDDGQANTNSLPWSEYHQPAGYQDFMYDKDWNQQWRHALTTHGNILETTPGAIVPPPSLRVVLMPVDVVSAGAKWSIDGGTLLNSGDNVQGLTPGTHTLTYTSIPGWDRPGTETITLTNGVAVTVQRFYVQQASLMVWFDSGTPTGAAWRVNSGDWTAGGVLVSNISAGTNYLSYKPVQGWFEPPAESVALSPGEIRQLFREYAVKTSAVSVIIMPTNAASAGAQWRVDGGALRYSGDVVDGLGLGDHQITFGALTRWITPAPINFTLTNEVTMVLSGKYTQVTGLAVDIVPDTAIATGAQWRVSGGVWTNSGVLLQVPPGTYTVDFKSLDSSWLPPASRTVVVLNAQVTEILGTYFRADVIGGNISTNNGEFYWPYGMTVDAWHRLYVADTWNDRVQSYDPVTHLWTVIGPKGTNVGQFRKPIGIIMDPRGILYVADQNNNRIQKRVSSNAVWSIVGSNVLGNALGQFNQPSDVAVDASYSLYVADYMNDRVQKLTTGGVWSVFITNGITAGRVSRPRGLFVDGADNIYVTDAGADSNSLSRVQKFSKSGQFVGLIGDNQSVNGGLNVPAGLVGGGGNLYVADSVNSRVAVTPEASAVWSTLIGSNSLNGPQDVAWDPRGFLYIVDTLNSRILSVPIVYGTETNGMTQISPVLSSGTNTSFTISWYGMLNWIYAVQYTANLIDPVNWQYVPGCTNIVGLNMVTNCTDNTAGGVTNRFYRIIGY